MAEQWFEPLQERTGLFLFVKLFQAIYFEYCNSHQLCNLNSLKHFTSSFKFKNLQNSKLLRAVHFQFHNSVFIRKHLPRCRRSPWQTKYLRNYSGLEPSQSLRIIIDHSCLFLEKITHLVSSGPWRHYDLCRLHLVMRALFHVRTQKLSVSSCASRAFHAPARLLAVKKTSSYRLNSRESFAWTNWYD